MVVEEAELSPHPVLVETSPGWCIMGENELLLENLDFMTAVSCLISLYYIFDINYHPLGQKCMIFLAVAVAGISYTQSLPVKVRNLFGKMKLST